MMGLSTYLLSQKDIHAIIGKCKKQNLQQYI